MLASITPREAWKLLSDGRARLVDIREADEIEAVRVAGAVAAPLSVIRMAMVPVSTPDMPVIFACNSGNRVRNNARLLESLARGKAYTLEGGMQAWVNACLPVERGRPWSLERQVRVAAGSIVLAGLVLSLAHPIFLALPVTAGCGLIYAGVTGSCAMMVVLKRLPWNREK